MVLVDTSVWVDYLCEGDDVLVQLLSRGQVAIHPMVVGELACGNLQKRKQLLVLWENLPACVEATHKEALYLLDSHQLMGRGIGYVDLHLIASCLLSTGMTFWSRDKRLMRIAETLNIAFIAP